MKKEALELSLKYSFVTPLTSMVVTKPPGENTDVLHKPKEGEAPQLKGSAGPGQTMLHMAFVQGTSFNGEQLKCELHKHITKSVVYQLLFFNIFLLSGQFIILGKTHLHYLVSGCVIKMLEYSY